MSLDDDAKSARVLKAIWNDVRDEVLRDHPWNFAVKRASCARLAAAPAFEWDYQYQLPSDCLRVLHLEDVDSDYQVEGDAILTDETECNLVYVARMSEVGDYDAKFAAALAYRLAADIAYAIANNATLAKAMQDAYQIVLWGARTVSGQEDGPAQIFYESWAEARV
jgi:hypothetical protein